LLQGSQPDQTLQGRPKAQHRLVFGGEQACSRPLGSDPVPVSASEASPARRCLFFVF
jgi:hypothetical protein